MCNVSNHSHHNPLDLVDPSIDIYLHPTVTDNVSEGNVYNSGNGSANAMTSEIHILTPSAYKKNCCTLEGWEYDDTYKLHVFIHEYLHSP
jgi:hypothetical protein